eukprot:5160086-Pyramimonas_sp.AAC.1
MASCASMQMARRAARGELQFSIQVLCSGLLHTGGESRGRRVPSLGAREVRSLSMYRENGRSGPFRAPATPGAKSSRRVDRSSEKTLVRAK